MALTNDAKAEIAAAIAIVREDRMDKFMRDRLTKHTKSDPPTDPKPSDPPADPPPPKEGDPEDPPKVRKSSYWGEILDD